MAVALWTQLYHALLLDDWCHIVGISAERPPAKQRACLSVTMGQYIAATKDQNVGRGTSNNPNGLITSAVLQLVATSMVLQLPWMWSYDFYAAFCA